MLEIFESCLGGGVAYFKEQYERVVELDDIQVRIFSVEALEPVTGLLGDDVSSTAFTYKVGDAIDSSGTLLFSTSLEGVIPESALGGGIAQDQVEDILGDFGTQGAAPAASAPGQGVPVPSNIGRVLDIQLTATARLGRVEMPISDILALGPGSIIEVGHSVDEPIELLVNDKLIARGDVVVVDEKFGLRITEIVSPQERIESLG
ncbi:MAG: flagellar motor switch protein FliN [bacterium]|nr:flagellar motor switch protein FliN [bacterium]